MTHKRFVSVRRDDAHAVVSNLSEQKKERVKDTHIITVPLDKNKEGSMVVRILPNKPKGSGPTDNVDTYGIPWYVIRYQHYFERNGVPVSYNCPTSIGKECPICKKNGELWNSGHSDIVSNQTGNTTKRKAYYYSNCIVKEVNGKDDHEDCGKVKIVKYGAQLAPVLIRATADDKKTYSKGSIFWEINNPFDENGKELKCEGKDFLICAIHVADKTGKGYTKYDVASKFISDPYPLTTNDEDYLKIISEIKSLEDYILDPSNFNTYDEIQARLDKAFAEPSLQNTKSNSGRHPLIDDDELEEVEQTPVVAETKTRKSSVSKKPDKDLFDDFDID